MSDSLVLNSLAHKATGISVTWSFQAECEKQCTSEKTGIMCFPSLNVINNLVAVVWKSCSLSFFPVFGRIFTGLHYCGSRACHR